MSMGKLFKLALVVGAQTNDMWHTLNGITAEVSKISIYPSHSPSGYDHTAHAITAIPPSS